MANFSDADIEQINQHSLSIDEIQKQLIQFQTGFPYANIIRPATINDGIIQLADLNKYITIFENNKKQLKLTKFVPASGAATRMFKDLFSFLETGIKNSTTESFLQNITKFAFFYKLQTTLPKNFTDTDLVKNLITESGLNYGNTPKGLLIFHQKNNEYLTPLHEHLFEAAHYSSNGKTASIHFTVSAEHEQQFKNLLNQIVPIYSDRFQIQYDITLSLQDKSTDTIAVNPDNTPFRGIDNKLVFRPAGHGALIKNLNDINADIIFIKNIDNVCRSEIANDTLNYKKALAGLLLEIQQTIFMHLQNLHIYTNSDLQSVRTFIEKTLNKTLPNNFDTMCITHKRTILHNILNCPLRVCGVVPNTGAPGGGPFWTSDSNGKTSLQIIESAQIAPAKRDIMNKSTHFNPVDLVCAPYDYQHNKFNLLSYIDETTGFISKKSVNGTDIKAMERPGLWNGAMAKWNTIFVEVPQTTFTPVKTVIDLLSPSHTI